MSASKRVIIDKAQPGTQYKVGQSYTMPAIAADAFIAKGHAHEFGAEDWARQQKAEDDASADRKAAKAAKKAQVKKHRAENAALLPLVEAKDVLASIDKRLASAQRRLDGAEGKDSKNWAKTVKAIKAERKDAAAAVAKLEGDKPEAEAAPPKIEMS